MKRFHILGMGPVNLENAKHGNATIKMDTYTIVNGPLITSEIIFNIQTSKGDKSEIITVDSYIGIVESEQIFKKKLTEYTPKGQTLAFAGF